jgi:hypothetical protein
MCDLQVPKLDTSNWSGKHHGRKMDFTETQLDQDQVELHERKPLSDSQNQKPAWNDQENTVEVHYFRLLGK